MAKDIGQGKRNIMLDVGLGAVSHMRCCRAAVFLGIGGQAGWLSHGTALNARYTTEKVLRF